MKVLNFSKYQVYITFCKEIGFNEFFELIGNLSHRGDDDHRWLLRVFLNDSATIFYRCGIFYRCAAKLKNLHVSN
jgi:hypothetical protein